VYVANEEFVAFVNAIQSAIELVMHLKLNGSMQEKYIFSLI
jgi:hypothetical protein